MKVTHVDPAKLIPADYNPRAMSENEAARLRRSIEEFGFVQPVVVNTTSGLIVGGHQRVQAALELGIKTVPVTYVELDDDRERALNIALNKISGDWEYESLVAVLKDLEDTSSFDLAGFDFDEFQRLQGRIAAEASKAGREGVTPPPDRVAKARFGEVYRLGPHTLVCGDSLRDDAWSHMDGFASLMVTDPPYNVGYVGGTDEALTIENDKMDGRAYQDFLLAFLSQATPRLHGTVYMFYGASQSEWVYAAWREARMHLSSTMNMVWDKGNFTLGRSHYQNACEHFLYGWHDGCAPSDRYWCGDRTQSSVWRYPKPSRSREHPTMKPVGLIEQAIRNSSRPGDTVADPFCGSGTTLIAAANLNRACYTIELDPRFVDVTIARYQSLSDGPVQRIVEVADSQPAWWEADK